MPAFPAIQGEDFAYVMSDSEARCQALQAVPGRNEISSNPAEPPAPSSAVSLRQAPMLVSSSARFPALLRAIVYRLLHRQSRLLLWADGVPRRWQAVRRLALHVADALLVSSEAAETEILASVKRGTAVHVVPGPYDIGAFLGEPSQRGEPAARRIIVCGALTPECDPLHVLHSIAAWAECRPEHRLDIVWIGDGDLRGVLAAQSLPHSLSQRFLGVLTQDEMVCQFAQSGLLIAGAPARAELVAQAMASGLVVLFDRSCRKTAPLQQDGQTGVGVDSGRQDGLRQAIADAMEKSTGDLNVMRAAARLRVLTMDAQGFQKRLDHAAHMVDRDVTAIAAGRMRFLWTHTAEAR